MSGSAGCVPTQISVWDGAAVTLSPCAPSRPSPGSGVSTLTALIARRPRHPMRFTGRTADTSPLPLSLAGEGFPALSCPRRSHAMTAEIRKILTQVDETLVESGKAVTPPTRRAVAVAVIANPFAGRYQEDLSGADRDRRRARRSPDENVAWRRSASLRTRRKASARPPSSARAASSNMPPPSCIPRWARRSARRLARARR